MKNKPHSESSVNKEAKAEAIRAKLRAKRIRKSGKTPLLIKYLWTLSLSMVSDSAFRTGVNLALFADKKGSSCYPGQETLAAMARKDEDTIRRNTRKLEKIGLVSTVTGKGKEPSYYTLRVIPEQTLAELSRLMDRKNNALQSTPCPLKNEGSAPSKMRANLSIDLPRDAAHLLVCSAAEKKGKEKEKKNNGQTSQIPYIKPPRERGHARDGDLLEFKEEDFFREEGERTQELRAEFLKFWGEEEEAVSMGNSLEYFRGMAEKARKRDNHEILAPVLLTAPALRKLQTICNNRGTHQIMQVIQFVLEESNAEFEMPRWKIQTWSYFDKRFSKVMWKIEIRKAGLLPGEVMYLQKPE